MTNPISTCGEQKRSHCHKKCPDSVKHLINGTVIWTKKGRNRNLKIYDPPKNFSMTMKLKLGAVVNTL